MGVANDVVFVSASKLICILCDNVPLKLVRSLDRLMSLICYRRPLSPL